MKYKLKTVRNFYNKEAAEKLEFLGFEFRFDPPVYPNCGRYFKTEKDVTVEIDDILDLQCIRRSLQQSMNI